ncbi:hypothetical protein RO3G_13444 [Rhizopus delemar RA 99-880]|uniref:Uncharacterized protein n=3 Tax=Rhizopus TaxID=4842 RepID=I1CJV3_RHIO9|nr:hypothetical protein RO3G_13444 [Rhizopus delemar RA 99-880]|eukprot:EIE88733.1 hypothetical protein RO3G_13444 [Rhizopus delemar RA 99-880]
MKMVCKSHLNTAEEEFSNLSMVYPGDLVPETKDLNYRERSVLSPIKLVSQITRKSTLVHGRIGHYEVKGPMYTTHNYEFAEMAYGGTLSLFFVRGDPAIIRKKKVEDAYRALQRTHSLLSRYDMPKLTFSLVNYHVSENKKHVSIDKGWLNNALFANENVNPQAAYVEFKDLIIGEDNVGKMVRYSHPSLLALIFPYLFTTCTGHYSMVPQNGEDFNNHSGIYGIPEN